MKTYHFLTKTRITLALALLIDVGSAISFNLTIENASGYPVRFVVHLATALCTNNTVDIPSSGGTEATVLIPPITIGKATIATGICAITKIEAIMHHFEADGSDRVITLNRTILGTSDNTVRFGRLIALGSSEDPIPKGKPWYDFITLSWHDINGTHNEGISTITSP